MNTILRELLRKLTYPQNSFHLNYHLVNERPEESILLISMIKKQTLTIPNPSKEWTKLRQNERTTPRKFRRPIATVCQGFGYWQTFCDKAPKCLKVLEVNVTNNHDFKTKCAICTTHTNHSFSCTPTVH